MILNHLRVQGPVTQAEIARATGLSRATVNNVVQQLRDLGTIEYQWRNRREALVTLTSTQGSVIAVTVQERAVRASLFDFSAQVRRDLRSADVPDHAEAESSPTMVLDLVRRLVALGHSAGADVIGVALAIEGPIERTTGAIAPWAWQRLPNWKGVSIRQYFDRHLRLPIVVDNDANLAAFAEWSWGEGRGQDHFLQVMCSSGIGGGFMLGGRIYQGGTGLAGEIGHLVIEDSGDLCFCGSRGCLTSFATERAILRALRTSTTPRGSLDEVVESARNGDAACQRVLFEAGQHIGQALATVVRVMGPNVIAVGGTLARAGDILLDGLKSAAEVNNLRAIGESPRFCIASIVEDAVELGSVAAILAEVDQGLSSIAPWMRADAAVPALQEAEPDSAA